MDKKDYIVRIDWLDPHSIDEWTEIGSEDLSLTKCVISIGRLIKETKKAYVLTLNYAPDDDSASCTMIIPKNAVRRIEVINGSKR